MSAKFYPLPTDIGAAKLASAAAIGVLPTSNAQQTQLVAEKHRADPNILSVAPQNN